MQLLAVNAVPQADSSCAFNASGDTTFTQRTLTVGAVKYQDTLCPKDLRAKWTQILLRPGSNAENADLTFSNQIAAMLVSLVHEHVETLDWQGDTTSGSAYLNKYDGLIKIIDAASGVVTGNTGSATSFTSSNIIDLFGGVVDVFPSTVYGAEDLTSYVAPNVYRAYVRALGGFASNVGAAGTDSKGTQWFNGGALTFDGINVELASGMSSDRMVAAEKSNLFFGTGLLSDTNEVKVIDMADIDGSQNVRVVVRFTAGIQHAIGGDIVLYA